AMFATRGPKTRSVRPIRPPGMKKAQLSMSMARTNALSAQATTTNHGADSPTTDRATPITKKAAMPSSASATAVAFEIDMSDSNAVVDRTIRTCRFSVYDGPVDLIGECASYYRHGHCADSTSACLHIIAPVHI